VQQIAIGGRSKAALRALWVDLLGADPVGSYRSEADNVDEDVVSVGDSVAQVEIDLMQPIDPDRAPKVNEPPLNHIGLWIDDLAAAVAWLGAAGVHLTRGARRGAAGYEVCFIQPRGAPDAPRSGEGVLIELVQAPKELIDAHDDLTRSRMTYIRDMPSRDD
jgi:lactoylglutathione lyase